MSLTLEKVLSKIEKGAEEWLEVLRNRKKQTEEGETLTEMVPKLIGHIEKVEQEFEEQPEGDRPVAEKEVSVGLTTDREAAAAGETGSEQATGEDTEQVDKMARWINPQTKMKWQSPRTKTKWQNPRTKTIRQLEVRERNQGQFLLSAG